jgi:hypothetical protein
MNFSAKLLLPLVRRLKLPLLLLVQPLSRQTSIAKFQGKVQRRSNMPNADCRHYIFERKPPPPLPPSSRVFTTFRILEISYISNVFFCFVYHSKIYFSDPDSNFNKYLCKITIFPVFWRLNCELCNVLITIPFVSFLSFGLLLFLYSINTKYSPRFQRHLLLVKFLFEGIRNFVWKSCQIIRNVV